MRRSLWSFLVCLFVVGLLAAPASARPHARPFWGTLRGEVTASSVTTSECSTGLRTVIDASGPVTRLGRSELVAKHCKPTGTGVAGGLTLTAANGDLLHMTYSGTLTPPPTGSKVIVLTLRVDVTGGTGRFEDADGAGDLVARIVDEGASDPSWPVSMQLEGTIEY